MTHLEKCREALGGMADAMLVRGNENIFYLCGFSFSDGKPFVTVFFGLLGLFLAPIAFLQASDFPARLSLIAMTLYVLAALLGLLKDRPMPTTKIETEESSDE